MTTHASRFAMVAAAVLLVASAAPLRGARAQTLAQRVSAVRDGTVELHYAARPGTCGDGRQLMSFGRHMQIGDGGTWNGRTTAPCLPGPARVRMELAGGQVRDVRTFVGPLRTRVDDVPAADLGEVSAREAAAYFTQLAATAEGRPSEKAVLAAVLADSASVWRGLLAVARDERTRSRATRSGASFWLSRFAGAKLAGHGEDLSAAESDDEADEDRNDPRASAVFALSQLRNREGIPPLIQVARTNRDAGLRRKALFWLGQTGDPRALDLFEEILK